MGHDADSGDDKSEPNDDGESPFLVKWDLTKASPVYKLIDVMVKWYYYYTNYLDKSRESREQVKGLLTTMSSLYGPLIIYHFWIYGATTTKELIRLYKFSKQTLNLILLKLERLGFIRRVCEVEKPRGKKGQTSWIYLLSIADSQAAIDAQLRYNEIIKQEQRESRERRKERRRLAAEEVHRRAEARDLLKDTVIQTLVTEFSENPKRPVSLQEIDKKAKAQGLVDPKAFLMVAIRLEEQGIHTSSYLNGNPDPNWKPPSRIRRVREERETNR